MNTNSSIISASRISGVSRRTETIPKPRSVSLGLSMHVVLIILSVLVWWIARDMVAITQQVSNASRLKFELSEELQGKWRIMTMDESRGEQRLGGEGSTLISVEVTGPTKRLNEFVSELRSNSSRYGYAYQILPADLPVDAIGAGRPITLNVDPNRLRPGEDVEPPAELSIRPLTGERVIKVTLEPFVTRQARVDLSTNIEGKVAGYACEKSIVPGTVLAVRGPLSRVEQLGVFEGDARLTLQRLNVAEIVNLRKANLNISVEELLKREPRMSVQAPLTIREDILVLLQMPGGQEGAEPEPVTSVPLELHFSPEQALEQIQLTFNVEIIWPAWMTDFAPRPKSGLEKKIPVEVLVPQSQQSEFNEDNVRVLVDLGGLKPEDFTITPPLDQPSPKRTAVLPAEWWYQLKIDSTKLTHRHVRETITDEKYQKLTGLTIELTSP